VKHADEPDHDILAESIVDQATGQAPPPFEDVLRAAIRERGMRGGLKGVKARAASMTKGERADIAGQATAVRWRQ
jgi:hypothetical protein